jgi:hypothetical protein
MLATALRTKGKQRKGNYRKKKTMRKRPKYNTSFTAALPTFYKSVLLYNEVSTITYSSSNSSSSVFWKPNDLYDPNVTGTGHQSKFSDQLYNLYQYGRCLGYEISVRVVSDSPIPMEIAFGPLTQSSINSHESFCEDKKVQKRLITNQGQVYLKYRSYVDNHLANPKGTALKDDIFKQTRGSPLSDLAACWFCISCRRIYIPETTTGSLYFEISLKQFTTFSQVKELGQS